MTSIPGKIYLIGAGPGDPELLTLRGRKRLAEADLILYDYLVNPQVLQHARPEAELVCLGRHGQGRIVSQEEINQRLIDAARAGQVVVRLKGGDAAIFGRTAEELAALDAAEIPYEVVPGITAAQAASCYAGIPLTHRDAASCVAFVTGQQCRDRDAQPLDMAGLAQFPGTLVFYMGVTSAPQWSADLLAHGKPSATPAAIIRWASRPQQRTTLTTLGELPLTLAAERTRPPAIIIVGEAAALRAAHDWFTSRPLFGRTVLVTRPWCQAESFVEELAELGAETLVQPAIEIGPPLDWNAADAAIDKLVTYDWLVFSSVNGVEFFLQRLARRQLDLRALGRVKIAAIGPGTAEALAQWRLRTDLQPPEYRAEALAAALAGDAQGTRILLLRASRGRETLAESLRAAGAEVEQAVVYESRDVTAADPNAAAALRDGRIDWVTVTSSAIARSLIALFGADLLRSKLAAISPLTADALAEGGYHAAAVADEYTTAGVVAAIVAAEAAGPNSRSR